MIIYNVRVSGTLSTTTTPIATIISGSIRSFLILEVDLEGMGTASQANEVGINRVATAGATGSGALSRMTSNVEISTLTMVARHASRMPESVPDAHDCAVSARTT